MPDSTDSLLQGLSNPSVSNASLLTGATKLLQRAELVVFGERCRLAEVEFYLYSEQHPDPFTHRHSIQQTFGQWYLHRLGKGYKNGSFKGIDITIGTEGGYGGLLIRSILNQEGQLIDGPSLCVDYILQAGGLASPRELDRKLACQPVWNAEGLRLELGAPSAMPLYCSPRVGLSLKRVDIQERPGDFIVRNYRFLTAPRAIRKGNAQLVVSMLLQDKAVDEIARVTGCPGKTIQKYAGWLAEGRNQRYEDFHGKSVGTEQLCRLAGLCS